MKKTTYAAVILYIRKGNLDLEKWEGWTDTETATEVLKNLKASYIGENTPLVKEMVLTDAEASALAEIIWSN